MIEVEKTELAYRKIEKSILNGSVPPGSPLRVATLAKTLKLSATPVREALAMLEEKRLVVPGTSCGWRVAPVSFDELVDLEDARLLIEQRLLEESIEIGGLDWEGNVIAAHHKLLRTPHPIGVEGIEARERWVEVHDGFHFALIAEGKSAWLKSFHQTTFLQLQRHHQALLFHPSVINPRASSKHTEVTVDLLHKALAHEHHTLLMQASLDRDQKAAATLLSDHVRITLSIYQSMLENRAGQTLNIHLGERKRA